MQEFSLPAAPPEGSITSVRLLAVSLKDHFFSFEQLYRYFQWGSWNINYAHMFIDIMY